MRKYLLAAAATVVLSSPAFARDGSIYVGADAGLMFIQKAHDNYQGITGLTDGSIGIKHKTGVDLDLIAGYDFGFIRAEAEAGYKHASIDSTDPNIPNFGPFFGDGGKARTVSLMGNLLADFGNENSLSFYAGGGLGVARTTYRVDSISFGGTDSNLAWQLIAGVRYPVSPNLDVGLKYRYFHTKYDLNEGPKEELLGKWNSHSLLASLTYNFGAALPPPPPTPNPPPPPPAAPRKKTVAAWGG